MNFDELARNRFSVRKYKSRPVPEEMLKKVLETGRIAPSAANRQPWHFVMINEKEVFGKLVECYPREWFETAPAAIVICGNHQQSWVRRFDTKDHCDIDIAIAADHMTLAATDLGLGTCWICNFDPQKLKELLQLPEHIEPMVILSIGYPDEHVDAGRHNQARKPFEEIVSWNGYHAEG